MSRANILALRDIVLKYQKHFDAAKFPESFFEDLSFMGLEDAVDASRYRWLRERNFSFSHSDEIRGICTGRWGNWPYDTDEGHAAVMDAAVDSAMKNLKDEVDYE